MNRTWELLEELRGVYKSVYLEHKITNLSGGSTQVVSIPLEHPKFLIKTVRVIPTKPSNMLVEIHDKLVDPVVQYSNDAEYSTGNFDIGIYDMVDIPYKDEDGTNKVHVMLKNIGSEVNNFIIIITGLTIRD